MNIAEISIRKRTITLVMTFMILAAGIMSYNQLGRLEDPEFTIKEAQVFTRYPGATAMEVAEEVTDRIETAVQQMGQIEKVTSISEPGLSTVRVEMKNKYDKNSLPQIWDELRRKVGDVQGKLPPGSSTSIVNDDFGDVYGFFFAIYGDGYSYSDLLDYAKVLRRELLLVQDVGKVAIYGDQQEVLYVEATRARLTQLGLSPQALEQSLSGQNLVAPSGKVLVDSKYIRIVPSGEFTSVEDIENLLIMQDDATSTKLYLKDIANVVRGYTDPPDKILRFSTHQTDENGDPILDKDGKPLIIQKRGVGLGISTVAGGNVMTMGAGLKKRYYELLEETPLGIEFGLVSVQSNSVDVAIKSFLVSLLEAVAIVIGVLMFAMGLRSGMLIGFILVLTVLATFILMKINGVMLERISLGALIIALGMLVDNAIVVVEGILVNLQKGMSRLEAASSIVGQTMWPLFGATIVAILAFAAIGASPDSTGEFCRSLFQVILYSLLLSWVLAITVTPLLGSMFLKAGGSQENQGEAADPYGGLFFRVYRAFLTFCLKNRILTVVVVMGLLALSIYGFGFVSKSFFPPSTRPQFMVHYWLPQGTDIRRTESDVTKLEKYLLEQEGVTEVATCVGQGALRFLLTYTPEEANSAYALLLVSVEDASLIDPLQEDLSAHLFQNFPDAQAFPRKFVLGPGDPNKIQVRFRGPDPDELRIISAAVRDLIENDPMATDVLEDWRQRVPMVRPIVAEAKARNAGITRSDIALALQRNYDGNQLGYYREDDNFLPILLRAPENERTNLNFMNAIPIYNPLARRTIPLGQVVLGYESKSENGIVRRRNRLPTITVKCDPAQGEASAVFALLRPKVEQLYNKIVTERRLSGYSLEWGGEYENSKKAQAGLQSQFGPILLIMVLTVIFLFNSIKQPLIIFLTVPLCIIGVTAGLLATNQPFGFMALLGILSLAGMLIKNAIVLIDEINLQSASGKDLFNAIVDSGISRMRPVSMAAMTTVLGMIPLVVDAFFAAMAVTIMFGLTFATVLTLVFVPVLYAIFYKVKSPGKN